jgi:tetratricopeptide (TPR) repeat protein
MVQIDRWVRVGAVVLALVAGAGCRSSASSRVKPTESDVQLASRATERADWRTAAERWWGVWLSEPGSGPRACAEASRALLELSDAESASNLLDQGLARYPEDAQLLELKGRALVKLGFRRAAEEYLERALAADPKRSNARLQLARVRVELGLDASALPPLRQYVTETGGDAESYALLARALRGSGDVSGALLAWRRTFELAPPKVEELLSAASLALDADVRAAHPDAPALCRRWLDLALQMDPQCTRAHFQLGVLSEELGAYDQAVEHYRRAVETDPGCLMAVTNLAILYAGRGDEARTREMVQRALELERDSDRRNALQRLLDPFERKAAAGAAAPDPRR